MSNIEHIVMARVQRIHHLRRFLNPTMLKVYSMVFLVVALTSTVSIVHVYMNMPSLTAPRAFTSFFMNALMNTEFYVKFTLLGLLLATGMTVQDLVKSIGKGARTFVRV